MAVFCRFAMVKEIVPAVRTKGPDVTLKIATITELRVPTVVNRHLPARCVYARLVKF